MLTNNTPIKEKLKILHVSDSYNAGVKIGIEFLVNHYSHHKHFLLWSSHLDSPAPSQEDLTEHFYRAFSWHGNFFQKYLQLLRVISEHEIDLIHLHSSIAGTIGRLIPSKIPKFYSPHCYSFQRNDISRLLKTVFFLIEFLLSMRKSTLALNWPIEIQIAERFFQHSKIIFVPLFDVQTFLLSQLKPLPESPVVLSVGRIRPQKDPYFLIESVKTVNGLMKNIAWVGVGDQKLSSFLEQSGITIIPWRHHSELWNSTSDVSASCISSSWESGPLTLFESLAAGYPVVCRAIPSLTLYGFQTFATPSDFGSALKNIIESVNFREQLFEHQIKTILDTFKTIRKKYWKPDLYSSHIAKSGF